MKFGQYIAKLSLAPASTRLAALKGVPVAITKSPNALREAMQEFFSTESAAWELRVQLCCDRQKKAAYEASARFRSEHNSRSIKEPASAPSL
jgi:hypothetical protein